MYTYILTLKFQLRFVAVLSQQASLLWLKIPPGKICFDMIWPSMFVCHGVYVSHRELSVDLNFRA